MTQRMPQEVAEDLYEIGGYDDINLSMSEEGCREVLEQMKDFASQEEINAFLRKTAFDRVNCFVDPAGLLQDKTGAVLQKPGLASGNYLSRLVDDTDVPEIVTGRWLQLAEHLNMPETPDNKPEKYHLCACALHMDLYSQAVEAKSEAYKKLFDERVIDALARFSSDSTKDHLALLLQIEGIWFNNGSGESLSFPTETGEYQRHGWPDGTSTNIDAKSFGSTMTEHILVWRQRLSPDDPSSNPINISLTSYQKQPPQASDFDFDHPHEVIRRRGRQKHIDWHRSIHAHRWLLAQLVEHASGQLNLDPTKERIEALAEKVNATPKELSHRLKALSAAQRLIEKGAPELKRRGQESEVSTVDWTSEVDDWLLRKKDEGISFEGLSAVLGVERHAISARIKSLEASEKTTATSTAASKKRSTTGKVKSRAESADSPGPSSHRQTRLMARRENTPRLDDDSNRGAGLGVEPRSSSDDGSQYDPSTDPDTDEESDLDMDEEPDLDMDGELDLDMDEELDLDMDEELDLDMDEESDSQKTKGKAKAKAKAKAKGKAKAKAKGR